MSRVLTSPAPARPAALTRDPVQMPVVVAATALLALGTAWLAARYGARQAVVFLVGGALGLVLHHAAFGSPAAYRALVTVGDGRGVRAQLLMLAVATVLFAPVLAAGEIFGASVAGAVAPAGVSVLVGAFVFGVGMQIAGGGGGGRLYLLGAGLTPLLRPPVGFAAGAGPPTLPLAFRLATPS